MRRAGLLLVAWLVSPHAAWAHTLTEATARLTLRDGHFDVALEADLFLLVPEEPTQVAIETDEALAATTAALKGQLQSGTRLVVDGTDVPLRLRAFPSPQELRAVAAVLSASGRAHGELLRLGFDALARSPGAGSVSLALPPALGPAVVSFVEPQAAYVQPGARAFFTVRRGEPRDTGPVGGSLQALVLGVVGTALLIWMVVRTKMGKGT